MLFMASPMKINGISTRKFVLLFGFSCALILASANNAKAHRVPMPLSVNLAIGDQHELGQVHHAIPEGDAGITQYVNFMIGPSVGRSGHVIIGPHDNLVTRSTNDFGPLPSPAALALRGTGTTIDLGLGVYDYLFAHYTFSLVKLRCRASYDSPDVRAGVGPSLRWRDRRVLERARSGKGHKRDRSSEPFASCVRQQSNPWRRAKADRRSALHISNLVPPTVEHRPVRRPLASVDFFV